MACQVCGEVTAVDGRKAYFQPEGHEVFAYTSASNKWSELPKCSQVGFLQVIIDVFL